MASKKPKLSPLYKGLLALAVLAVVLSGAYIIKYYSDRQRTLSVNASLIDLYETPAPGETPAPTSSPTPEPTLNPQPDESTLVMPYPTAPSEIAYGFRELHRLNPDLVGHLRIPSTSTPIDLFVVKRDNSFYLSHDFYGTESKGGTLFLDQANEIWPQDQHLLIYGHNMKNGTMFARLTKYKSITYASLNPFVYFDTLYENGAYVVLAAMRLPAKDTLTEEFNIRTFMFGDTSFDAFLYAIRQRALYITNAGANADDQLLSLVTCSYSDDDERFILITRRLREGETEADILRMIKGN